MPNKANWSKVSLLVKHDNNLRPFHRFLLSPEFVNKIIRMTNAGHIQKAQNFVSQAEWLVQQIQKLDSEIDLTWDFDIITELQKALKQPEIPNQ